VTHNIPAMISAGFDEAQRRDPTGKRTWIVLADFAHVVEYLWKAAWPFFCTGDPRSILAA
jgi:hypothetical protein